MLLCELSIVHESSLVADPVRQRMRWATERRPIALQGIHLQNYMLRRILPCVRGTALARPLARPTALDHDDGQFFRAMEWLMFFFRPPLTSMVFRWFW